MSQGLMGRTDQTTTALPWRTRANIMLALYAVAIAAAWHLAVAATSPVRLDELEATGRALLSGHPLGGLPGPTPVGAFTATIFGMLVVATFGLLLGWTTVRARFAARRRQKGFAENSRVREEFGADRVRASAAQTRPGLSARARASAPLDEVGLPLGRSNGVEITLPLEDHLAVIAPTGGGKSSQVMIPAALSAPGALVVTCTRPDILDVIAEERARRGQVWVFDPLDRLGWPEPMVWDPVAGCEDGMTATSRGLAFATGFGADGKDSTNHGFFRANAASALARLLHAAALDGGTIAEVVRWGLHLDDGAEVPQDIIRSSTHAGAEPVWASLLRSVATGADETVASSRQTLQQSIEPLATRSVMRWVLPRDGVPTFDPARFVRSTDTLVLVADNNTSTNVAPLCAMLLQEVYDSAKNLAARQAGGRIDPPIRLVGDEIANVAPLDKLPGQITDARGFGLQMILALQGLTQAVQRWGEDGATMLLGNCAAELYLAGLKDVRALNRASELVGSVEVARAGTSTDPVTGRVVGMSEQWGDAKIVRPEEARMIPDGHGLLIYRSAPPVLAQLTPWFAGPRSVELDHARVRTEARRITATAGGSAGEEEPR